MALTPRAALLVLLGLTAVVVWPSGATVRLWVLGVALLVPALLPLLGGP